MVLVHVDDHFGMLRLGGTGSASVRERLVGPGKALEHARPHWQSQCHPARSVTSHSKHETARQPFGASTKRFSTFVTLRLGSRVFERVALLGIGRGHQSARPSPIPSSVRRTYTICHRTRTAGRGGRILAMEAFPPRPAVPHNCCFSKYTLTGGKTIWCSQLWPTRSRLPKTDN